MSEICRRALIVKYQKLVHNLTNISSIIPSGMVSQVLRLTADCLYENFKIATSWYKLYRRNCFCIHLELFFSQNFLRRGPLKIPSSMIESIEINLF